MRFLLPQLGTYYDYYPYLKYPHSFIQIKQKWSVVWINAATYNNYILEQHLMEHHCSVGKCISKY